MLKYFEILGFTKSKKVQIVEVLVVRKQNSYFVDLKGR